MLILAFLVISLGFVSAVGNLTSSTNDIVIPESYQNVVKLIFGLPADYVLDFSKFVIYIAYFFVVFVLVFELIGIVPGVDERKALGFFIALVITLLLSISKGLNYLLNLLFDFADMFKNPYIKWIVIVGVGLIVIIGAILLRKLMRVEEHAARRMSNRAAGMRTGVGSGLFRG